MTFAVGAMTMDGVLLLADRETVGDDGSKGEETKIFVGHPGNNRIGLATSSSDLNAAKSLADDIFSALASEVVQDVFHLKRLTCGCMKEWSKAHKKAPPTAFMMACALGGRVYLNVLEPPLTFTEKHCYAIGSGARVGEPILQSLIASGLLKETKAVLMNLIFAAKRASEQENGVGTRMNALFVSPMGAWAPILPDEIKSAADALVGIETVLNLFLETSLSMRNERETRTSITQLSDGLLSAIDELRTAVWFRFLDDVLSNASSNEPLPPSSQ